MEVVTVMTVMQKWGEGAYTSEGKEAVAAATFAEGCKTYATGVNAPIYKDYTGPSGVLEWVAGLDQIEFKDFTPSLVGASGDKVYLKCTYSAVKKSSGKSISTQEDLQEWTVKDGKVAQVKFWWGGPEALASLWA